MPRTFTAKQKLFCKEYLVDLNATKACLRAGYKTKNPDNVGHQLLGKAAVKQYLDKEFTKRNARIDFDQDTAIKEVAAMAFSNLADIFDHNGRIIPLENMPRSISCALHEVVTSKAEQEEQKVVISKYTLRNKLPALEMLFKHFGLFHGISETLPEPIHLVESKDQFAEFIEYQKSQGMGAPRRTTDKLN